MKHTLPAAIASLSLFISASAFAHGGMEHIMGTIKDVSATSITVTTEERDVEVHIDESTKFEGAPSKELRPGGRVVVHAKKAGGGLHAEIVKSHAVNSEKHHHDEKITR